MGVSVCDGVFSCAFIPTLLSSDVIVYRMATSRLYVSQDLLEEAENDSFATYVSRFLVP